MECAERMGNDMNLCVFIDRDGRNSEPMRRRTGVQSGTQSAIKITIGMNGRILSWFPEAPCPMQAARCRKESIGVGMRKVLDRARTLEAFIRSRGFEDQQRLPPERELSVAIGLTRGMLRSALAELEAAGKIWRQVGLGTFVGRRPAAKVEMIEILRDSISPSEIMEARMALEPTVARLAALRASINEISVIAECLNKGSVARTVEIYEVWDSRLHEAIAQAAHNNLLLTLFNSVNAGRGDEVWGRLKKQSLTSERTRLYTSQHRRIVQAITERDADHAETLMRQHIATVRKHLSAAED